MSLVPPSQLFRDLARVETAKGVRRDWSWLVYLGVACIPAVVVFFRAPSVLPVGPLLTATSILTGLTFTLALRFWERSVDARKDPFMATDGARLNLVDRMRTYLLTTVLVGVLSTLVLALVAILGDPKSTPRGVSVMVTGLFIYQIVLVGASLIEFYRASYDLR